jgi:hypothetical protein
MRLTNVALYSNFKEVANLSFKDTNSTNPYQVKKIDGLDADEIVPNFYGTSSVSNVRYNTLSLQPRTIALKISLNPEFALGKTHSDLRDDLYASIASSRTGTVTIKFQNEGDTVAQITGFVSKLTAELFDREPGVSITIDCDDATLKAPTRQEFNIQGFGNTVTLMDLISTSPHGFRASFAFTDVMAEFSITDPAVEWAFVVDPGTIGGDTGFIDEDVLYYSSETDDKYLYLLRGGVEYHLVDRLPLSNIWPILFPKENDLNILEGPWVWNSLDHYPTYWGV